MREPQTELEKQIEAAFDYRGDVTLSLRGGEQVLGYLFNRDYEPHSKLNTNPFVELYLPDGEKRTLPIESIEGVELSGKDHAAQDATP